MSDEPLRAASVPGIRAAAVPGGGGVRRGLRRRWLVVDEHSAGHERGYRDAILGADGNASRAAQRDAVCNDGRGRGLECGSAVGAVSVERGGLLGSGDAADRERAERSHAQPHLHESDADRDTRTFVHRSPTGVGLDADRTVHASRDNRGLVCSLPLREFQRDGAIEWRADVQLWPAERLHADRIHVLPGDLQQRLERRLRHRDKQRYDSDDQRRLSRDLPSQYRDLLRALRARVESTDADAGYCAADPLAVSDADDRFVRNAVAFAFADDCRRLSDANPKPESLTVTDSDSKLAEQRRWGLADCDAVTYPNADPNRNGYSHGDGNANAHTHANIDVDVFRDFRNRNHGSDSRANRYRRAKRVARWRDVQHRAAGFVDVRARRRNRRHADLAGALRGYVHAERRSLRQRDVPPERVRRIHTDRHVHSDGIVHAHDHFNCLCNKFNDRQCDGHGSMNQQPVTSPSFERNVSKP